MSPVLETRALTVGYQPGLPVVKELDLEVEPGQVVALLGPNGAGKTTTMLALAGVLPPVSGSVLIGGEETTAPLHVRARQGLAFVTEERSVLMGLTAAENLRVGGCDQAEALALFPELEKRLDLRGGLLSGGEQQMLTLARALGRRPRLLLADELSMGLAQMIVTRLLGAVRDAARERGTGVLLVEQHVRKVLGIADHVYVMRRGEIAMAGTAAEMRGRIGEIEDSYLAGAQADAPRR